MLCGDGILDIRRRHSIRIRKIRECCICGVLMGAAALVFWELEQELGLAYGCEALVSCGKGEVLVVCVLERSAYELVLVVCVLERKVYELVLVVCVLERPAYELVLVVCVLEQLVYGVVLKACVLAFLSDHNDFRYGDHYFFCPFSIPHRHHHDLVL